MKLNSIIILTCLISTSVVGAQRYVMPPTSSTSGYVPVISDEKMEQCVKLYNHSEQLYQKLNYMHVDNYSQQSFDNYNRMVDQHSRMTTKFNAECAGKQSQSACKAVQKLNKEQGLPYQDC